MSTDAKARDYGSGMEGKKWSENKHEWRARTEGELAWKGPELQCRRATMHIYMLCTLYRIITPFLGSKFSGVRRY